MSALAPPRTASTAATGPPSEPAPVRSGITVPAWVWAIPPVVLLALAVLYPLGSVISESFTGSDGGFSTRPYVDVLSSTRFRAALTTTILIAVGSTVGCLVLGLVLALIIAFVPFPGSGSAGRFIDTYLSFPSFLITLALLFVYGTVGMANGMWTDLTGADSGPFTFLSTPWGVILAEVTFFTPFVLRPLLAAFAQIDTAQLEAASSLGARPARVVRSVILPEALPALVAGGALVLVLCLNEFAIVLFTGAKDVVTLPMLVYSSAILEADYTTACVVATINATLSIGLYLLYRSLTSRLGAPTDGGRRARP
ncbi:2-aminoethylphosphonate ABC transporter permease subunit [Nocardiopsis alba]|uniref:2-aminoethylphosphonate ABC transporter, permease protein n=1 Tax=Nocardiopsis alba (strain ATCC BAA-2165 / BE74) TaxID=1205910 RepID=J7L533_NOCAA|nr:2-aminoethylphosphonate ABC transporter permease subunit [Nocardiopsis alba]AFR07841.1 2-aminoethylphosphonate ABC transporter, permease protein [Nocardiopsis alba ATCC BAA-2165]